MNIHFYHQEENQKFVSDATAKQTENYLEESLGSFKGRGKCCAPCLLFDHFTAKQPAQMDTDMLPLTFTHAHTAFDFLHQGSPQSLSGLPQLFFFLFWDIPRDWFPVSLSHFMHAFPHPTYHPHSFLPLALWRRGRWGS